MFYENYPYFLDSILLIFTDNYKNSKTVEEIKKLVFKYELSKGYNLDTPNENLKRLSDEVFTYTEYLLFAILFLSDDGLIIYDKFSETIKITSKGFLKIKTEGFADKIKNDKNIIKLQNDTLKIAKFSLIVSVASAIIACISAVKANDNVSDSNSSKTSSNHSQKIYKPTNVEKPRQLDLTKKHINE